MPKSKVYFTTFKTTSKENLLQKLHRLMNSAGFEDIDFTKKYAAIKIHFGEYGNLAFPLKVIQDPDFKPVELPVTRQHLKDEGLGDKFIQYISNWEGFIKK